MYVAFSKNLWLFYKWKLNSFENLKKSKQMLSEAWKISKRKEVKAEISRYFCEKTNKINNFQVWRQKLVKSPLIRQIYFNILIFWCGIWSKKANFGLVTLSVCPFKSWNWKFWRIDFWNWILKNVSFGIEIKISLCQGSFSKEKKTSSAVQHQAKTFW